MRKKEGFHKQPLNMFSIKIFKEAGMKKYCSLVILFLVAILLFSFAQKAWADNPPAYTTMYYAMQNDDLDALKACLKKSASLVNYNKGELLLGALGMVKDPQVIKMLLAAGANPNALQPNTDNNTLHVVIDECKEYNKDKVLAIVKMLVAKGADVNHKRANDGYTPIHVAVRGEQVSKEIVAALLTAKNVDVNVRCNQINDSEDGAWPALFYIVEKPNDTYKDNFAIFKMIMAKNPDLTFTTPQEPNTRRKKWNVLHLVCSTEFTDRVDMVEALVNAGMDIEALTADENLSPLHLAMSANNPKICTYLLTKGADYNSKDTEGTSVLAHAKGWGSDKHLESAKVVIDWAEAHPK
jgi:ankyrin repeat protein